VRAAALAAVAAEDPAVGVAVVRVDRIGQRLDGAAGDAACGVDDFRRHDGPCRAALDAVAAAAAANPLERRIVAIRLLGQHELSQQHIGAELRRDQQRLASDPPQSRFDGEPFLEQRRRIDESPARKSGIFALQRREHRVQHPSEGDVVVACTGIGGHARAAARGIAFTPMVFEADGADHHAAGSLHQTRGVEPLVEVAFQVAERRMAACAEPFPEVGFAVVKGTGGGNPAQIEARAGGKFFDRQVLEHRNNLSQM
jgi:hypothetical protein